MRKFSFIVGGLAIVIGVSVTAAFMLTSGITESADRMFTALQASDVKGVQDTLAEQFKTSTEPAAFDGFVKRFGFDQVKDTSWSSRAVENSVGTLNGTVTTKDGRVTPVEMKFVKENDAWKVLSIVVPQVGIVSNPQQLSIPSDDELKSLAKTSFSSFAKAVKDKDFTAFYETISVTWKQQASPASFKEIFKPLLDTNPDFTVLAQETIRWTEPAVIDEGGLLVIKGHHPQAAQNVSFRLSYLNELGAWKLVGLNIVPAQAVN